MTSRLPAAWTSRMKLPLIAAPMFLVSGPDLVLACCRNGVIGSFPLPNARTLDVAEEWFARISSSLGPQDAPWAANVITHSSYPKFDAEMALIAKYRPPLVITALGGPQRVIPVVRDYGGLVFADVNSVGFARKAAATGVDGLVLVSAGAGGHTGATANFAFLAAVREFFDGIIVMAGAISDGRAIRAAEVAGADLAYMGTGFIATTESIAVPDYKQMVVDATGDDIVQTNAITGVHANFMKPSLRKAGLDPDNLVSKTKVDFSSSAGDESKAWRDVWSAGQGVGATKAIQPAGELIATLRADYARAVARGRELTPWGC